MVAVADQAVCVTCDADPASKCGGPRGQISVYDASSAASTQPMEVLVRDPVPEDATTKILKTAEVGIHLFRTIKIHAYIQ